MPITRRHLLKTTLAAAAGCGAPLRRFPFDPGRSGERPPDGLSIDYFGVACFQFHWAGKALLLDPYFSRFNIVRTGLGKIAPDPAQVDPYIPQLRQVDTVLVGHAHYDHMLDLPYLAPHFQTATQVISNATLKHTLAPFELPLQWTVANELAANPTTVGTWIRNANGRIRIMPIASSHPNHWAFIHLYPHAVGEDRSRHPQRAAHYQEGRSFAFLIDFLAPDDSIAHRVFAQTSSNGFPSGSFPREILDEKSVDIAIVSMDSCKEKARGKPSIIDYVDPSEVFFGHWDSFFRRKDQTPHEVMKVNLPRLHRYYQTQTDRKYRFPGFDTQYFFPSAD